MIALVCGVWLLFLAVMFFKSMTESKPYTPELQPWLREDYIYEQMSHRLRPRKVLPKNPSYVLRCEGCGEDVDLALWGPDSTQRGRARDLWEVAHANCNPLDILPAETKAIFEEDA
jgi:hypothetical protein